MPVRLIIRLVWIALGLIGGRKAVKDLIDKRYGDQLRAHPFHKRFVHLRELAGLAVRTLGIAVGAGFTVLAGTGAATLRSTGPTWLVIAFAVVAVTAAGFTAVEVWQVRVAVNRWRQRAPELVITQP